MRGSFNIDGTLKRDRKAPCGQCGATRFCDECWENVSDWSPFSIWHCLLCRSAQFVYGTDPARCEACGWDEATECGHTEFDHGPNGELIAYDVTYDPVTRKPVSRTRKDAP